MGSSLLLPVVISFRLFLAFIPLSSISGLQHDHQLSSPLTSYSRLKEGLWLYSHNIDPYAGGIFRHSPLFLSIFSTVLPPLPIIWALGDIVGTWTLLCIWCAWQHISKGLGGHDGLVAAVSLLNPYLFLLSLALSTSTFENMAVLLALMFASEGKPPAALLALVFLTHLSISTSLLLLPVLMLLVTSPVSQLASPQEFRGDLRTTLKYARQFVIYWLVLFGASSVMIRGDWGWVCEMWRASLTLPDLMLNPGLWWYFFTEIFDHFQPFFLMVHLMIYILLICIKFQHDLLYVSFLLVGILGIFKAYLTLTDPGLFLSMFVLFPEVYPCMFSFLHLEMKPNPRNFSLLIC
ncbi:PIG-U-domain-containing protein [Boletus coccyginus]|nr:PIG-U-domain-containing protein [Boletus coccyginus]